MAPDKLSQDYLKTLGDNCSDCVIYILLQRLKNDWIGWVRLNRFGTIITEIGSRQVCNIARRE